MKNTRKTKIQVSSGDLTSEAVEKFGERIANFNNIMSGRNISNMLTGGGNKLSEEDVSKENMSGDFTL